MVNRLTLTIDGSSSRLICFSLGPAAQFGLKANLAPGIDYPSAASLPHSNPVLRSRAGQAIPRTPKADSATSATLVVEMD